MIARLRATLADLTPRDWALIVICAANVAAVLLLQPPLFVWQLLADLFLAAGCLGALYLDADHHANREADENFALRIERLSLRQQVNRLSGDNMQMALKLAEYEAAGDVVPVPLLRIVPPQRDGSEHEWPRIARVLGIEADEKGGA